MKNSDDLVSFLKNPPYIPIELLLPNTESRIKKSESDKDAIRLIHNYVASAKTVVDHTRRLKRKYLDEASQREFDRRVQSEFKDCLEAQIILQLRNYILHVDLPSICNRVNIENGNSRLAFLPKNLLLWDGWHQEVKEYLKSVDKGYLMLQELFEDYTKRTKELNNWLLKTIIACHYDDLEALYSLNDQILKSVNEDGMIADPLIVVGFTRETYERKL